MHRPRILLSFCLLVLLTTAVPSFADDAAERAAYEKEWKEVMAKYPRVAEAHVQALETIGAAIRYAKATDQSMYAVSEFRAYLGNLCDGQGVEVLGIYCPAITTDAKPSCPGCRLSCMPGSNTVGCWNCRLHNIECKLKVP